MGFLEAREAGRDRGLEVALRTAVLRDKAALWLVRPHSPGLLGRRRDCGRAAGGIRLSRAVALGVDWTLESLLGAVGLQSGRPGRPRSGFHRVSGAVGVTWMIGVRVARRPCRL